MGYADLALIITANNEYHLMTNGNDSLRRLNNWVAANKLQLAPEKSEAVIFKWKLCREHVRYWKRRSTTYITEVVQRRMLIRIAWAVRTMSTAAYQVISGIWSIDILVLRRKRIYRSGDLAYKTTAKCVTLEDSQMRWKSHIINGQWTKWLLLNLKLGLNCRFRRVDYYPSEVVSGHGVFRSYALCCMRVMGEGGHCWAELSSATTR